MITSHCSAGQSVKDKDELDGAALAAPSKQVEVAYKAVMKPVEGTILTVAVLPSVPAESTTMQ